ncbi:phenylalanine--tRNA ligase subunit beta [Patescibacteria group bacterium]|nr:phenylalanine--tRNA ligase subunit beta [Patescibacteria group bacterium]
MNILASYSWLKEYLQTNASPEEFAREVSLRSMSVESVQKLADSFDRMVLGVIRELKEHPNANKLRIAVTDVGERTVEIVCGGSNLYVDQKVFVALPGAKVRWHGEGDLIELAETEIRGVKSVGMICAAAEVGFPNVKASEREIWDLTEITDAKAGAPIAQALGLDDVLFDIEITTNRPDCMGVVGLAREAGAALGATFTAPVVAPIVSGSEQLEVVNAAKKLCSRYMAVRMDDVKVGPSPWWVQKKLLLAGFTPINNVVDITNLVLHELGQPMHAFDAAKISGGKIEVRLAKKGEKLVALDGKEYTLTAKHLVIADTEGPLAIAGVMGGLASGVSDATTSIVFEAATFHEVSIRKTSRDLNLQSQSQLLFEKGLSTEALPQALARAVQLCSELAHSRVTSVVVDERVAPYKPLSFAVVPKKIRSRIGVEIPDADMYSMLTRLGFSLTPSGKNMKATVPYWRDHDIEGEIDFTEEIARLYGYHQMPYTLPSAPPPSYGDDVSLSLEQETKRFLANDGYTEFFGYSFVDAVTLEKYLVSPKEAVEVLNPLSEELSHLRPVLLPSVLRDIERNQATTPSAEVFELSRVYVKRAGDLPDERFALALAVYGEEDAEMAFRRVKGTLERLSAHLGLSFTLEREEASAVWHAGRSARIVVDGQSVGVIGQVHPDIQQAYGILRPVFALSLDLEILFASARASRAYVPVPAFPTATRDVAYLMQERVSFSDLVASLSDRVLLRGVSLVDIYRGKGIPEGMKSVTISYAIGAPDRTLTTEEIDGVVHAAGATIAERFKATVR